MTQNHKNLIRQILPEIREFMDNRDILIKEIDLIGYSYDSGTLWKNMPDCVLFPRTTEHVSNIMKTANNYKIPVTPRGGGTNQSGGSIPIQGGIVLCLSKMNKILSIDEKNLMATVEPGVVLQDFNIHLTKKRLYFPPDPQSFFAATIGGIIAENAGGPVCLKYGVTEQYVIKIEVVLADGTITELGGLTMNNHEPLDLAAFMISSEGTLGIVTRATLKLLQLPESRKTIIGTFNDLVTAGKVVFKIKSQGIIPSKMEIIDNWVIKKVEEFNPVGFPLDVAAVILFETDGSETTSQKEAEMIRNTCQDGGARETYIAKDDDEAEKYWAARRAGFAAAFSSAPNVLSEDIVVPVKHIPALLKSIKEISEKHEVTTIVIGHAGDGNMHPDILTDINNPDWFERAENAMQEIIDLAIDLNGVISGEHGIGLEKKQYIDKALDSEAIVISKQLKKIFDPNNIMNPGKIWN